MDRRLENLKVILLANVASEKQTAIHLDPVLKHIEKEIELMVRTIPAVAQVPNSNSLNQRSTSNIFNTLSATVQKLVNDPSTEFPTIDEVAKFLLAQGSDLQLSGSSAEERFNHLQQLAIAFLGWITLLFSWHRTVVKDHCCVQVGPALGQINLHLENCSRTIGMFIRLLGLIPTGSQDHSRQQSLLYLSILNFYSLSHIGRLRIEWVPHLSQHLVLDIPSRTLRLFRYPSICLLAIAGGDYQELNRRYVAFDLCAMTKLSNQCKGFCMAFSRTLVTPCIEKSSYLSDSYLERPENHANWPRDLHSRGYLARNTI